MTDQPVESTVRLNPKTGFPVHPIGNNTGLSQAYALRDFSASSALQLKKLEVNTLEEQAARARALKDLTSTWMLASERIRLLRGRPLPGSLRPVPKPSKSKPSSLEPVQGP
jgi:hypothetical protein